MDLIVKYKLKDNDYNRNLYTRTMSIHQYRKKINEILSYEIESNSIEDAISDFNDRLSENNILVSVNEVEIIKVEKKRNEVQVNYKSLSRNALRQRIRRR